VVRRPRYLRSPYRPTVLRLVTAFSIIGVARRATLVIACDEQGFRETLQDRFVGRDRTGVTDPPGAGGIPGYKTMGPNFAAIPESGP